MQHWPTFFGFAAGTRRISSTTLGMLRYIAPTLQLLLGVWLLCEPDDSSQATGYLLIWIALLVFTLEGRWQTRARDTP